MPIRRRWKKGEHLIRCERTGRNLYSSQIAKDPWNGSYVDKRLVYGKHPQDYVTAMADPYPVNPVIPDVEFSSYNVLVPTLGQTSLPMDNTSQIAALYDYGIGDMVVGGSEIQGSFIVR